MQVERLGPYRVGKQIGKGGMGSVFEAVLATPDDQSSSDQSNTWPHPRVAVKALSPQLAMAEGFRERFEAEIESLKKLRHEGIVRLLGYGEQDGILFYSMELVEGTSLEEEINSGRRFDWRETLQIGIQVCHALKHAHDHGVVHRDIKPANLMLTAEGKIKIADFGIARLFGGTQLTTAGGVLGTADYMSPEQADGRPVTEKCDQYSLGGVMYALLAGRPPFQAKTMPEMLQLQRYAKPEPVRHYAAKTPEQLERLITQLLEKEASDRFPNVMILGRHMKAMEKALSRPEKTMKADDASPAERPADDGPIDATLQIDGVATRPAVLPSESKDDVSLRDLYNAPTLAQSDEQNVRSPTASARLDDAPVTESRSSRFTTVDEEAARQRECQQGGRPMVVVQLVGLLAMLAALVWGGWYLMRPLAADELFQSITATVESEGTDDLRNIASRLDDFLARFADDPRAAELEKYVAQLKFQKFERQARLRARVGRTGELHPVEQIYSRAIALAADDPAQAAADLRALLALYDPADETLGAGFAPTDVAESDDRVVDRRLLLAARKQIKSLNQRIAIEAKEHLRAIRERLALAEQMQQTNPQRAAKMYRAIIQLYGEQDWAKSAVDESRAALRRLAANDHQ